MALARTELKRLIKRVKRWRNVVYLVVPCLLLVYFSHLDAGLIIGYFLGVFVAMSVMFGLFWFLGNDSDE
jgi:hypothetical protein